MTIRTALKMRMLPVLRDRLYLPVVFREVVNMVSFLNEGLPDAIDSSLS
jgi:hypothetical protein